MAATTSREGLKDYCLRRLGYPTINIEVDDEQLEERIDDALLMYRDYHFDGTEHVYYKIQATATDVTNQYFTLPDNITGVTRVFRMGSGPNISNLFNIRYQIHLNDLFDYSSATYSPYVMAMRHIETLEEIFIGEVGVRFNRHMNKLYVDCKWGSDIIAGSWVIVDGYRVLDPETYTDIWNDPWLKKYTTALFKRQWGSHLRKFSTMPLAGGTQFNGQVIYDEAVAEIEKLEADLTNSFSLPVTDMIG